jgi:two-component system sensor histidine kinase CreC
VHCTIEDEGPGLPDYAIERVFDRFYSLPRPSTGHKSSGLGLCFVREIALLHQGSVRLENRPSGGAIATLVIPVSKTPRVAA